VEATIDNAEPWLLIAPGHNAGQTRWGRRFTILFVWEATEQL